MNGLALALIAFSAGAELSLDMLRTGRSAGSATAVTAQVVVLPADPRRGVLLREPVDAHSSRDGRPMSSSGWP